MPTFPPRTAPPRSPPPAAASSPLPRLPIDIPTPGLFTPAAAPTWFRTTRRKRPTTSWRHSRVLECQRSHHLRAAFAQHFRKRCILERPCRAEKQRALAVGDIGLSYAAVDRHFSQDRICG